MYQDFRNSFEKGRNTDTSPEKLEPSQYVEANNVQLVGDSSFFSLRNIAGTTHVQNVVDSALVELVCNPVPAKFLISGSLKQCLVLFTVIPESTFNIYAYDTEGDTLYSLYQETVTVSYTTRIVDAKNYPENGVDVIYFTDNAREVRSFKCEIPSPYVANFLTEYDLSLQRRGSNGTITGTVGTSGTLLSGTYQFVYRMADPDNKKFTKWSTLTNPFHVYSAANSTSPVNSGIGLPTGKKIALTITPSTAETDHFDYLQIAVVENIGPTAPINASLLEITAIPGTSLSFDYKSNAKIDSIPLEDITVDLAQIATAKTLNVKENRLFLGNIGYTPLEFDNGVPAVTGGSILRQADSSVDSFSSDDFASKYKGHWRGEVYRYGVVYEDEFGNKSTVAPLDLSGVTGNAISGALDMKFPDRSDSSGLYTILNGSDQVQSLGLRLTGLNNHPSWAKSLEIVRVKREGRLKNILFQSPIIPMATVHGIGALGSYPNTVYYKAGSPKTVEDASPMTAGSTLVPKNFFWPDLRSITKVNNTSGAGINKHILGESKFTVRSSYQYATLFPPDTMYNFSNLFVFSGSEKIDFIDEAILKSVISTDHPIKSPAVVTGDDQDTNVSGTFYATVNNQYYFNSGHAKSALSATNIAITDNEQFDNLGQPTTIGGISLLDYGSLQTQGLPIGIQPNIQRSAVVKLATSQTDVAAVGKVFSAATWNNYVANTALSSASATLKYNTDPLNDYINQYAGYSNNNSYVGTVGIVNVKSGAGDDRYGDPYSQHEYISTGCKYTFSAAEVATLEGGGDVSISTLDVWGGDCFIGAQVFKISDSNYSVVNQPKNNGASATTADLLSKWNETLFKDSDGDCVLCLPVAVENASQFIQVVLESDYNGEVRDSDILGSSGAATPIMTGTPANSRAPLTYNYNINLNKQNDQKIYLPELQFSFSQDDFSSRIAYSDLKIYNSDQAGFDIFRVANIYDLEESKYPITKLAVANDNLYAIQEKGVTYIPTGERQVETADAGTLAIRSGEVIGKPIVIDSERGSQHLRSVTETGNVIYLADNAKKSVYALSGTQLQPITKDNQSRFRSKLGTQLDEKYIISLYDPVRKEYWLINNDATASQTYFADIFNEEIGWISNYEFDTTLKGGAYVNQNLYLVGVLPEASPGEHKCSVHTMYSGSPARLFGTNKGANVKVSANPLQDLTTTFCSLMVHASERLSGADFEVIRESALGNQTASVSLDSSSVEGTFRAKIPEDGNGALLRGTYCFIDIEWLNTFSTLKSIWTRWRKPSRNW